MIYNARFLLRCTCYYTVQRINNHFQSIISDPVFSWTLFIRISIIARGIFVHRSYSMFRTLLLKVLCAAVLQCMCFFRRVQSVRIWLYQLSVFHWCASLCCQMLCGGQKMYLIPSIHEILANCVQYTNHHHTSLIACGYRDFQQSCLTWACYLFLRWPATTGSAGHCSYK